MLGRSPLSSPLETAQVVAADRRSRRLAGAIVLAVASTVALVWRFPAPFERAWLGLRLAGRDAEVGSLVTRRVDYAYEDSPFLRYLAFERRLIPFDTRPVSDFADAVAQDVAWRLLVETGEADVAAAERALWTEGDPRQIPLWIAAALRRRGVFYHLESLLSRSFDPALHAGGGEIHLDCDQLVHLFAHVGWRLDLDVREVRSPMHMYLRYQPPTGVVAEAVTVETTGFRRVEVEGDRADFLGRGVGEDFFVDADYYASGRGGTWASPALAAAAGLYVPATDRDIDDTIVANVTAGLYGQDTLEPVRPLLLAALEGTRSYLLVSNLHQWSIRDARAALDDGRAEDALPLALQAADLRARYPDLLIHADREEGVVLALAREASGDPEGAREVIGEVLTWYAENTSSSGSSAPASAVHAEARTIAGRLGAGAR